MTEKEWFACEDWTLILNFLENRASQRKLLLSNLALCRALAPIIRDKQCIRAMNVLESIADGTVSENDQNEAQNWARSSLSQCPQSNRASYFARCAVYNLTLVEHDHAVLSQAGNYIAALDATEKNKSDLMERGISGLRCVNCYHPITPNPSWLTSTVIALAQQMYDSQDFTAMPILADALQDASCDNPQILEHCRGPGPHVRGCFVVDLCLNKS
jgi:hypothetical protein